MDARLPVEEGSVTDLDYLDGLFTPSAEIVVPTPRRCFRHQWAVSIGDANANPACARCGKPRDAAIVRRNRTNRQRGKSTSAELARYLGCQNVEGMNWKWDIQSPAFRLQSKRDATGRSAATVLALIEAITPGDYLRGLYRVAPRQRLASGSVTALLREWVAERGWALPTEARLVNAAGTALLELGLAEFRELVGGTP